MNDPRHDSRAHGNRRRGFPRRVAAIVASWLAGGALVVGVLLASGALGGGSADKTVTIRQAAATTEAVADTTTTSGGKSDEELYEAASPGVVEIKATIKEGSGSAAEAEAGQSPFGESAGPEGYGGETEGGAMPEGFGTEPESGGSESMATGSGFEIDDEGTVVTAAHVVDEATSVKVILQDGTTRTAEVLGVDDASDIAVIRFDPEGAALHPLALADSSALKVGASVAAIGAPFEYAWSFSTGIVSGLDRTIEAPNGFTVAHAIQTDAAVNPGNSGGPLLNAEGEVIGVVDQIATDGSADQSSGVGFAVPSNLVAEELEQLEAGESVEHAYLGVATSGAGESADGAEIAEVVQGSPAAEAGLEQGDVITALDGEAVGDSEDLVAAIAEHAPGDAVAVEVKRGSESLSLKATLGAQPAESGVG